MLPAEKPARQQHPPTRPEPAMTILPLPAQAPANVGALAQQKLHKSPYYFLKRVSCEYHEGVLTLRGRVPFARLKDCAESIVWRVDGIEAVVNCLEVGDPPVYPLNQAC
jgi:hypothetical protein